MADKKISDLTAATTPLAGTEVLPIVQSSTTKKVSVADLTAGRTASASAFGVGTTAPDTYKAQFASYNAAGSFNALLHSGSGTFPKVSALSFGGDNVSFTYTSSGATTALTGSAHIAALGIASSGAQTDLAFYTTSGGSVTEKLRILSTGKTGVGFSTPQQTLSVSGTLGLYTSDDTTGSVTLSLCESSSLPSGSSSISGTKTAAGQGYMSFNTTASGVSSEKLRITASGDAIVYSGEISFNTAGKGLKFTGDSSVIWRVGTGTPEGAVSAPVGSLFTRTDGGANTTLYVKESGAGNTGWVAK